MHSGKGCVPESYNSDFLKKGSVVHPCALICWKTDVYIYINGRELEGGSLADTQKIKGITWQL